MEPTKSRYKISTARLQNWDYGSNAFYFVTICTKSRVPYFGEIIQYADDPSDKTQGIASLRASRMGEVAQDCWEQIPANFPFVELDEFVVMPDHIHGILLFNKEADTGWQVNKFGPQSNNLASVIRGFKSGVKSFATRNEIEFQWQSRFYDRVIRNRNELDRIRKYIQDNPANWLFDKDNGENLYR
ncbi:MAG: transposase [Bacteroidetes bacterium]|nr:transposase [Bacteroidota bacterium]